MESRSVPVRCFGEMLGTFMLVLFGCGTVHAAVLTGAQSGLWQGAVVWGVAIAAVVVSPLAAGVFVRDGVPSGDAVSWGSVVFLAVITSIVGYVGWYWALDRGGIARIATLQFLQPLSGFVLAATVLGEQVTTNVLIGGAAIIGGIIVAQRARAS